MIFEAKQRLLQEALRKNHEGLAWEVGIEHDRDLAQAREHYEDAAALGNDYAQQKATVLDPKSKTKMNHVLYQPMDELLNHLSEKEAELEVSPQKKILVVDDAPDFLLIFRKILEKRDFNVLTAENGNEAFKRIQEHPDICCVFVDLKMPEMNGFEFLQLIRKMQVLEKVPIIVETAFTNKELIDRGIKQGINGWIKKPFDEIKILEILHQVL